MNWIEEVRQTVELLGEELDLLHEFLDDFPFYWMDSSDKKAKALCQRATVAYKNAVAAIPDEDPMMKLLKWLNEAPMPLIRGHLKLYGEDQEWNKGELNAYETVVMYIEDEFGYKLDDE